MSLLQQLQRQRLKNYAQSNPASPSGIIAAFEIDQRTKSDINLHNLSTLADGSPIFDASINWGDGTPVDKLRCPYPDAVDPPVNWLDHSYKTSGLKTITLVARDAAGNTTAAQHTINITLGTPATSIPYGRTFAGKDLYPGIDTTLLPYGQPFTYMDTTEPTEATFNPALQVTANDVTTLNAKFAQLGATGGTILYSGGDITSWVMPNRPFDSNGVRYNTWIWIKSDASVRPVGYPPALTRMTPAIGVQLPKFRSPNSSQSAIIAGDDIADGRYCYRVRFTGFGITTAAGFNQSRSGGSLVQTGSLSYALIFEQCYSYLPDENTYQIGIRRDFYVRGGAHAWLDGWHWGNRDLNTDSQAIGGWTLNAPLKIVNCFLSATEPFMTGGAPPLDPGNPELPWRPQDVEIRRCHCWRDMAGFPGNIRYYDGSGPLLSGKLLNSGVSVSSWNSGTQTLTLATPVTVPDGSWALPFIGWRIDYVVYIRSGTGAGQGGLVQSFNDATHLVIVAGDGEYRSFTTPPDATSVIELRLKLRWITKNNGEFKDCRRALVSECVFENGGIGDDSQFFSTIWKTTVNDSTDLYPYTGNINLINCVYLNVYGGAAISSLPLVAGYGSHGLACNHLYLKNILMIQGDVSQAGGFSNKCRPLSQSVDQIVIEGLTAIGDNWYGITQFDVAAGGQDNNLSEMQTMHGLIVKAPTTPVANAYWFGGITSLDLTTIDFTGNAVYNTSALPNGAPGTWYAEPTAADTDVFNNPIKTDLWGAGDFDVKPALTGLRAATPKRLDWPTLKDATNGVRASTSIIPYQW